MFDEGAKFLDWNNDGLFDLVIHDFAQGPFLFTYDGIRFVASDVIPTFTYTQSYGMNVADLNNDGLEDIVLAGGSSFDTVVLLNNGKGFERSDPTPIDAWGNDCLAFADIDRDGRLDIVKRFPGNMLQYARNQVQVPANNYFRIEVVGQNGEHNQQGRVIRVKPRAKPGVIFTRAVDSGSGYMAQGQYELLVGTPSLGVHDIEVYFAGKVVTFPIEAGQSKRVFASGAVETY
jgi:hypothetical protein